MHDRRPLLVTSSIARVTGKLKRRGPASWIKIERAASSLGPGPMRVAGNDHLNSAGYRVQPAEIHLSGLGHHGSDVAQGTDLTASRCPPGRELSIGEAHAIVEITTLAGDRRDFAGRRRLCWCPAAS
jgi:hypothetical protein